MTITKHCSCALSGAIVAALALSGCDKLTPNAQSQTMELLHAGSEKVCVAADVQKSLHDLVVPKVSEVNGGKDDAAKLAAIKTVGVSYADTTLASFDKAVSKVSCSAMVRISGSEGKSKKFAVTYVVSPSADNPSSFIVTGNTDEARAFADDLVGDAIDTAVAKQAGEQQEAEEAQAKAKLLATLTPKWLVGSWVGATDGAETCRGGDAFVFGKDHSFEGQLMTARWALNGDKVHLIGSSPKGQMNATMTITEADALSFTFTLSDDAPHSLRRCGRDELDNASQPSERDPL